LASWENVGAFSNAPNQGTRSAGNACYLNSTPFCCEYECINYINRFFGAHWGYDAYTYFTDAQIVTCTGKPGQAKGLVKFENGGVIAPEPDDILVFDQSPGLPLIGGTCLDAPSSTSGQGRFGHVALVTSVSSGSVTIIEQNWSPTGTFTLPISTKCGDGQTACKMAPRAGMPILGWVRAPIRVQATLNGNPWPTTQVNSTTGAILIGGTGAINYSITGPPGTNTNVLPTGTKVPDRAVNFPSGSLPIGPYALAYGGGGPSNSTFVGISPSPTLDLISGRTITFTMEFTSSPPPPQPTWTQVCSSTTPQFGNFPAMAYDAAQAQIVLFGGQNPIDNTSSNETWTWNGTSWTQSFPATPPPARSAQAMAYDAGHNQIVMFGGSVGGLIANDTWVWDGSTWTQMLPATSPSPRLEAAMVYDDTLHEILLIGGSNGSPSGLAETWAWDGTNWTMLVAPPVARTNFGAAYDYTRDETVVFGGKSQGVYLADTELFNDSIWTSSTPVPSPPIPRQDDRLAFDVALGQTVLFGGAGPLNTPAYNDTWTWNGTSWTQSFPATSPPGRSGHAMAYDAATSQVVVFGGINSAGAFTDTWVYGAPTTSSCPPK